MTRKERWILSEWRVAKDRVERWGEDLLAHRLRTPFAEVDLVTGIEGDTKAGLTMIEVKSWSGEIWAGEVMSPGQKARLERSRTAIEERSGRRVTLLLAVVSAEGPEIRYFPFPL